MSFDCNNSAFAAGKTISDLPVEVISHIFQYLTVSDIHEARLVCTNWYVASQAPALLERENVVCTSDNSSLTPDMLLNCKRNFLNICLVGQLDTNWYHEDFWRKFGISLRSLSLTYSNLEDSQLLKILSYCPKLRSLEIRDSENLFSSDKPAENKSSPTLVHLRNLSIAHIFDPSTTLFEKLVDCAPNLTSLSLSDCLTDWLFRKDGTPALTYKHILKYLRDKPHHIDALLLMCCSDEDDEAISTAATLPNLRLSRLETDYSNAATFLTSQRWLQHVELTTDANDTLLQTICLNLPDLKHLSLPYCLQITHLGMSQLPSLRKLTSLSLLQCYQVSGEAFLRALCQTSNGTLRKLAITKLRLVSHLHVVALAKAHPAMTHLDLSHCVGVTDWSVQAIFRYQKSLQSLSLVHCRNLTDVGLSGRKLSVHKYINGNRSLVCKVLRNLECGDSRGYVNPSGCGISNLKHLQRLDLNSSRILGTSFKYGLKLPSLRHLILDYNVWISEEAFRCLFENNRTIETLELSNCYGVQDSLIPVIVQKLQRLRSIDLEDCMVSDESIGILKQHCKRVKN